ncbi:MAG: hypothetical protein HOD64_00405 [Candidatus Cloacimonetes bacterium]|jgi:hypothetical protein|nr:hypothetical protein [Candidatus Cloacimonadota bacterium]MBT4331713.1 hypothetical protein [Candidatus Cloacimonadota bacterium]
MEFRKYPEREITSILSIPFIWGMLLFFIVFDIALEIYHQISFRIFRLPIVDRSKYIKIDRHKLDYLSFPGKMRCAYCDYANGVLAYAVKITGETEKYWGAVKHEADSNFIEPPHQKDFVDFGDEEEFVNRFKLEEESLVTD